jgi:uncharacterized protein involved in tellurium resistance
LRRAPPGPRARLPHLGTVGWAGPGSAGTQDWCQGVGPGAIEDTYNAQSNITFVQGQVIYADSGAGTPWTGAQALYQALYQAIGSGNLRPYVQGQDDRGGAALSN